MNINMKKYYSILDLLYNTYLIYFEDFANSVCVSCIRYPWHANAKSKRKGFILLAMRRGRATVIYFQLKSFVEII